MSDYIQLANTVRERVANNKLKDALNEVQQAVARDVDVLHTTVMQQAQYESLRKHIQNQTLDHQIIGVETNKIRYSLLELVRELEHQGRAQIQVFLSYSQKGNGHALAKKLHDRIENEGFVAFLDTEDIRPGEDWAEFIMSSLKASDYFVLLLSPDANNSEMVIKEVLEARNLQSRYGKPLIIPVRMEWPENLPLNHQLAGWLKRIQYLSWDGQKDTETVIAKILDVISERKSLRLTEAVEKEEIEQFLRDQGATPVPAAPLEIPSGSVLLNSPFYIGRKDEQRFVERITAPKALLRIRGPRQYGKTSLLSRGRSLRQRTGSDSRNHGLSEFWRAHPSPALTTSSGSFAQKSLMLWIWKMSLRNTGIKNSPADQTETKNRSPMPLSKSKS